jgi:hypothetical protein
MSEHTKGPWKAIDVHRGFIIEATDYAYDVAIVRNIGNHDNEANAALIAAAPELLQALKEIVKNCDDGFAVILGSLVEQGRAAIAKAEGKQ